MMFVFYNLNPKEKNVGDCVVRAISKALNLSWEKTYVLLCVQGLMCADLPSSNEVWSDFLKSKGFKRRTLDDAYTIEEFCEVFPKGVYVVGTGSHAVAIVDGCFFDAWNSGRETVLYYFEKEKEN
jgi:hypothetical protein